MTLSKILFYCIEFFTCYATVFYSNFLYFYMKNKFGFGEMENLLLAALNGILYVVAAWQGGKFAERFGCIRSLYIGLFGLSSALVIGLLAHSATMQVIVFALWTVSICFVWPALEALISKDAGAKLSDMVGWYNVLWAASSAIAYFTAGIFLEHFGMRGLFWFPLCMLTVPIALLGVATILVKKENGRNDISIEPPSNHKPANSKKFLKMAWLANPLSYVAINTLLPLMPSISSKLGLSTAMAGMTCSIWMFGRLAAFVVLRRWNGWHYRFNCLILAFVLMAACFAVLILSPNVMLFIGAEIGFGLSIGLIYYSSLYYSMNASEHQGAHGGLHEAIIGAGLFAGPACGAGALYFLPHVANAGAWSACGLLALGFGALVSLGQSPKNAGDKR